MVQHGNRWKGYGTFAVLLAATLVGGNTLPATSGRVVIVGEQSRVEVVFNDHDRRVIGAYYTGKRAGSGKVKGRGKGLPPGLAKRESLPPGLERQLHRNGTLPPGLEARALPEDLERELSALPEGYVRVRVGVDLVLMDGRTRVIMDVIKDVAL